MGSVVKSAEEETLEQFRARREAEVERVRGKDKEVNRSYEPCARQSGPMDVFVNMCRMLFLF